MLEREWFTAAELADLALPGMPATKRGVLFMAERGEWTKPGWKDDRWRERQGRGGGVEFHYSLLPSPAQVRIALQFTRVDALEERKAAKAQLSREEMWSWFERLPETKKAKAREKLLALDAVQALIAAGVGKVVAMMEIAAKQGIQLSSLYNWEKCVHGVDRHDWLPYLAPRHVGSMRSVECSPEAWEFVKADYLRQARPNFTSCYRRLLATAKERGWTVPSERTLQRRIEALPAPMRVFLREGEEALKRMYPAQRRDRSVFHALEAVNADGHKWDVFVRWPDSVVGRPVMVAFQDLYSGKILSWRVDRSENKETVRLAFGDLVETFGIPDHCWLDNGRNFASKWLTGGTPNRYRFKVRDDEPSGIMTQLNVQVHWTTPYSGQSKPIERAFRDMAQEVAKHPRFAGAWTGNNPMAKPEDYGSKAVPIEVFLQTIGEGIAEHNARIGRRTAVCNGRSFDDVFAESYAKSPIRKAAPEQRRLWLMAAEAVGVNRRDGTISLLGNVYWDEFLAAHRGQKVSVRFDPEELHEPLHVYRLDGVYLGAAACTMAAGFNDVAAAQAHSRKRNTWRRAAKQMAAAEVSLSIQDVADMLPKPAEPPPAPETKVVRLVQGNAALKPAVVPVAEDEEDTPQARMMEALRQANAARRMAGGLRLVGEEEAAEG